MPARTRNRSVGHHSGIAIYHVNGSFAGQTTRSYYERVEVCEDVVGSPDTDNPFDLEQTIIEPSMFLNGYRNIPGGWEYDIRDFGSAAILKTVPLDLGELSQISDEAMATETLARSNPSRPNLGLPVFVAELRDLPHMIKDIGNLLLGKGGLGSKWGRNAANHYLAYQFGWKPLISDLGKLFNFVELVDKRTDELDRLFNNGGLHRTVGKPSKGRAPAHRVSRSTRGTYSETAFPLMTVTWRGDYEVSSTKWGSVRWTSDLLPGRGFSRDRLRKAAKILVLGLDDPKALWDVLPWTWLTDWFGNVGDFIEATHNNIPCSPSTPCIMETIEGSRSVTRTDGHKWLEGGNGTIRRISKTRVTAVPSLSATLPFLNGRHLSILGALAVQRLR